MFKSLLNLLYRPLGYCFFQFMQSKALLLNLLLTLVILLSLSLQSWAWQYQVKNEVRPGQKAELLLVAPSVLKKVVVTLRSDRSKKIIKKKLGTLHPAKPQKIMFKPPSGKAHWHAKAEGQGENGAEFVEIEFDTYSVNPLSVQFFEKESSLETGRLLFKSNQELERVEVEAYGDEGELQWADKLKTSMLKGGRLEAIFSPRETIPRRLEIKVINPLGTWQAFRVVRWYADVPHEDILFPSNSFTIPEDQLSKLDPAVESIKEEIDKFRKAMGQPNANVDLQLYVAGYTDTVGDKKDNQKLSQQRALEISKKLRSLGVELKILYVGYGEEALLINTPDSTDEPRNRRVMYIVANTPPQGLHFPGRAWRTLK